MGDNKRNSDLRLKRFGHWLVLHRAPPNPNSKYQNNNKYWICVCDCGTIASRYGSHLRLGQTTSCGCRKSEAISRACLEDLTGRRFGRWLVLGRAGTHTGREPTWHVRCDCGTESIIMGKSMKQGLSSSCGCYRQERHQELCTGENHYNWQGGKSYEPYCQKWTEELRERIRNKFGRRCAVCGKSDMDNGNRLHVHHIDYHKQQGCSGRRWQLIPVCNSCHAKTNHNRWFWFNLFNSYWVNSYTIPQ